MRPDAKPSKVILALKRCIEATFDQGKWLELGYLIGKEELISRHPRLLRSLDWGDPDYSGHVLSILPSLLGTNSAFGPNDENVKTIEEFVGLEDWLRKHDPELFAVPAAPAGSVGNPACGGGAWRAGEGAHAVGERG